MPQITTLSSMATRHVLADLGAAFTRSAGVHVALNAMGGVDAAARVQQGEHWDVVILATDALSRLLQTARLQANSRQPFVRSQVVAVVPAHMAASSAWQTASDVQNTVLAATAIGYSTGPSGTALCALFKAWGIWSQVTARMVQASAGVPVAQLLTQGQVSLGFQQASEMRGIAGVHVLGPLPADCAIVSTFDAALGCAATAQARLWLQYLRSPEIIPLLTEHGFSAGFVETPADPRDVV